MQPAAHDFRREALEQWKNTVRRMASPLPAFEEANLGNVTAVYGHVPFPLVNTFFAEGELTPESMRAVMEFAQRDEMPWMLAAVQGSLPDGLVPAMELTYMSTDEVKPPVRPLPALEYRPIDNDELALLAIDLNSAAYGMPIEMGRAASSGTTMWQQEASGFVAFLNDEPVSTASVVLTDGARNVIMVATPEFHRGKGYAEAVMRKALDAAGSGRTVLHASRDGYRIYERMGYQPHVGITLWAPPH